MSIFAPSIQQPAEKKSLGNINSDQVNSTQNVVPVKYLAGRRYLAGDYIARAFNIRAVPQKQQVGKGQSRTTSHIFYGTFAMVFTLAGRAQVDGVYKVISESEIVWEGAVTRGASPYEEIIVADFGTLRIYWGSPTQPLDSYLIARGTLTGGIDQSDQSTWPPNPPTGGQTTDNGEASGDSNPYSGHYENHPQYLNQCYGVFIDWKLGTERSNVPNLQLELKKGIAWVGATTLSSSDLGVNIAAVIYDVITDPVFGGGLPDSKLLTSSWSTIKTAVDAFRISPLISDLNDLRTVISDRLDLAELWLRRNGKLLELGYWAHGNINPATLPQLFDDDLDGPAELKPTNFGNTINRVVASYKDRFHHYNDQPAGARDANNLRIVGMPRIQRLTLDDVTDGDIATQYCAEYRTIHAQPSQAGMLPIKRERIDALGILPGDRFVWNSAQYSLSIVCRFLEMEWPEDSSGKVKCTIEAERGFWPNHYVAPGVPHDGDFHIGPAAIVRARIIELPGPLKPANDSTVRIAALCQRRNASIVGNRVHVSSDGGATYDLAEDNNKFCAFGLIDTNTVNPAADTDCVAWFRADSITGVANGNPVTTWNDDSGNSHNATQATAGKKPIRYAADPFMAGLPTVAFDGVDDYLRTTNGGFNGAHTIYVAFTLAQNQTGHLTSWGEAATGKERSVLVWDQGTGTWRVYYFIFGSQINSGLAPGGLNVMAFVVDASGNTTIFWYDQQIATGSLTLVNHTGNTPITLGADCSATPFQFANAHIAEVIIYNTAHNSAKRTARIDYLGCKYRRSAMVRLYGVDSDIVTSQTPQARADFTLLGFLEDDPTPTNTEIVSVGTVYARGDGLFKVAYLGALYGTPTLGHAADSRCWFIYRRKLIAIGNENFIPGSLRSIKLQAFTALQDYDLASVTPFNYTFSAPAPVPTPALAPSSQTFVTNLALSVVIPTGYVVRYTADDTPVRTNSRPWPAGGTLTIDQTCVIRVRCYDPYGKGGDETRCFYTELAAGSTVVQTCGAVSVAYSGAKGRTNGNLTLDCATSGATIHAAVNGAGATTHSAPWTFAIVVGDNVEYWASHSSMSDSAHGFFDNDRTVDDTGGGGYGGGGGGGHHIEP